MTVSASAIDRAPEPGPAHVGDPLPNALTASDLMRALNLGAATFFRYQKAGKFKRFEFRRAIGHKRYSGVLVQRYLDQSTAV